MDGVISDFHFTKIRTEEIAYHVVMIARNIDDSGLVPGLAEDGPVGVVVTLWPMDDLAY
jgi:hypothetical protein